MTRNELIKFWETERDLIAQLIPKMQTAIKDAPHDTGYASDLEAALRFKIACQDTALWLRGTWSPDTQA